VGGGNGTILRALSDLGRRLRIDYVDSSSRMIRQARTQESRDTVRFYCRDILEIHPQASYEVVITPFFLDCFTDRDLSAVMAHLNGMLSAGGVWLFTDFMSSGRWYHRLLTGVMYMFFRVVSGLRVDRLPEYDRHFREHRLEVREKHSWKNGYIESRLYRSANGFSTLS